MQVPETNCPSLEEPYRDWMISEDVLCYEKEFESLKGTRLLRLYWPDSPLKHVPMLRSFLTPVYSPTGLIYLDHAGSAIASSTIISNVMQEMLTRPLGNPRTPLLWPVLARNRKPCPSSRLLTIFRSLS